MPHLPIPFVFEGSCLGRAPEGKQVPDSLPVVADFCFVPGLKWLSHQFLSWGELAISPLPATVEIKLNVKPQLRRANICSFPGGSIRPQAPLTFWGRRMVYLLPAVSPCSLCVTGIYYSTSMGGSPGALPLRIVWK